MVLIKYIKFISDINIYSQITANTKDHTHQDFRSRTYKEEKLLKKKRRHFVDHEEIRPNPGIPCNR